MEVFRDGQLELHREGPARKVGDAAGRRDVESIERRRDAISRLPGRPQHHLVRRDPGGGAVGGEGQPRGLELGHQAVQVVQRLVREGAAGEVGLLEVEQLLLQIQDGLQVPQGDGGAVDVGHPGQVGVRVGEQVLDGLQGVLLPVQDDGAVGDEVSVLIQKAQAVHQGADLLGVLAEGLLPGRHQLLVGQQVAQGGVGRPGQQAEGHDQAQYQGKKTFSQVPHDAPPFRLAVETHGLGWGPHPADGPRPVLIDLTAIHAAASHGRTPPAGCRVPGGSRGRSRSPASRPPAASHRDRRPRWSAAPAPPPGYRPGGPPGRGSPRIPARSARRGAGKRPAPPLRCCSAWSLSWLPPPV